MRVGVRRNKTGYMAPGTRPASFGNALNLTREKPITLPKVRIQREPWEQFKRRNWQ